RPAAGTDRPVHALRLAEPLPVDERGGGSAQGEELLRDAGDGIPVGGGAEVGLMRAAGSAIRWEHGSATKQPGPPHRKADPAAQVCPSSRMQARTRSCRNSAASRRPNTQPEV